MKRLLIVVIIFLSLFSTHAADSPGNNGPKDRLRQALMVTVATNQERTLRAVPLSPLSDATSDGSISSPYLFSPDRVLSGLERRIEAYTRALQVTAEKSAVEKSVAEVRQDYYDYEGFVIGLDIQAVEKRFLPGDSICDALEDDYGKNDLLTYNDAPLRVEDVVPVYLKDLAEKHGLVKEKITPKNRASIYVLYQCVQKDWTISSMQRKKWKDVFALVLSDQAAENRRHWHVKCSFNDLRLNVSHYLQLLKLKKKYKQLTATKKS